MRSLDTAPQGVSVLVKSGVFRRQPGYFEPALKGYKIGEARLTEKYGWQWFTGVEGEITTDPCQPVGWWPLPGNEATVVDFKDIPEDWWLYGLFHNHTPIRLRGEVHVPFDESDDTDGMAFTVKLQHRKGGKLSAGYGPTPAAALIDAVREVELRWMDEGEER